MKQYAEEAKKNYCPKCEYYENCLEIEYGENEMCDIGYWEYLEQINNEKNEVIDKAFKIMEKLKYGKNK